MSQPETRLIALKEWCVRKQVSYRTAMRLLRKKSLPGAERVGGQWRVRENVTLCAK